MISMIQQFIIKTLEDRNNKSFWLFSENNKTFEAYLDEKSDNNEQN